MCLSFTSGTCRSLLDVVFVVVVVAGLVFLCCVLVKDPYYHHHYHQCLQVRLNSSVSCLDILVHKHN